MLTKEQYQSMSDLLAERAKNFSYGPDDEIQRVIRGLVLEYEAAHKPVAVPCSVCGCKSENYGSFYQCCNVECYVTGPRNDLDASKWNKLHGKRKLQIKQPFVVWRGHAYPIVGRGPLREGQYYFQHAAVWSAIKQHDVVYRTILGSPIDISDWLEAPCS